MKKNLLTLTFIIFSGLLFTISIKADNWEFTVFCNDGYHSAYEHKDSGLYQAAGDSDNDKNFEQTKTYCIKNDVSSIYDADIWGSKVYYCATPNFIGFDDVKNEYTTEGFIISTVCCPKDFPYIRQKTGLNGVCCNEKISTLSTSITDSSLSCGRRKTDGEEVIGVRASFNVFFDFNSSIWYSKPAFIASNGDGYYCPPDFCFAKIDSSEKYYYEKGDETRISRSVNRKIEGKCDTALIDDYGVFCVEGNKVTEEEYNEFLKIGLSAQKACEDFIDSEEEAACLNCYNTCPEEGTCSYSSLGCIETTKNGLIVRFFQIGLGIVGAFAIVRFIQAALLRQTADPSKIQESYDIITSIIIGLVVLLGSMVILKFIGVDVLQIIPFDFFK